MKINMFLMQITTHIANEHNKWSLIKQRCSRNVIKYLYMVISFSSIICSTIKCIIKSELIAIWTEIKKRQLKKFVRDTQNFIIARKALFIYKSLSLSSNSQIRLSLRCFFFTNSSKILSAKTVIRYVYYLNRTAKSKSLINPFNNPYICIWKTKWISSKPAN